MALLCVFAVVGGGLAGVFWTTIAPVAAEILGLQDLPAGLSLTWVLMAPPTTCAEAIALELRRQNTDSWIYLPPQIFTACMYIGGGLFIWVARGWKVGELEWQAARRRQVERHSRRQRLLVEGKSTTGLPDPRTEWQGTHGDVGNELEAADITKPEVWRLSNLSKNMVAWTIV
jgi:hypothetical protein